DWFKEAQEIAGNKSFFHWELEFPEIFFEGGAAKENPGWDAVVGNPPYVRQEQLGEDKNYLQLNYKVYNFASDIFAYFYEKSLNLTRHNGFMSFISNTFSKTTASLELRSYLKNSVQFISYTDFSDLQIFDGATTYPIIPAFRKNFIKNNKFKYIGLEAGDLNDLFSLNKGKELLIEQSKLQDENWTFESETDKNLMNKIQNHQKIGEIFGKSYYGVKTALNEVFIIDSKTKNDILNVNPDVKTIFKPYLEGKDLNKWAVSNADKFLILFPKGWTKENLGIDVTEEEGWNYIQQNYPKIAEHFEPYIEKAKKRYDKGDFWWELRACDYYPHFETGKIAWPNLQNSNKFSYDDEGFYINAPAVILPTNNKTLLCLLNSKLAWFFFKDICVIRSGGFVEMKPQYFEQFPVQISESTTPPERRAALLEEAKALYSQFSGAPDNNNSDGINRMDRINASTNPVNPVNPVQNGASSGTAPDG
ncbi:MAG: Eco57I restriction-modification methylase domain-containing protein, partial [Spirochaetes bacterium]|nr:Eco57I restriction-modification methylase domain-containing protein [Spirochaetota bacterium]